MKFKSIIGTTVSDISKEVATLIYWECTDRGMCSNNGKRGSVAWEHYYSRYVDGCIEFTWDISDGTFIGMTSYDLDISQMLCLAHNQLRYKGSPYKVEESEHPLWGTRHVEWFRHRSGNFAVTWEGGELVSVEATE